jgi:hypothetical protein
MLKLKPFPIEAIVPVERSVNALHGRIILIESNVIGMRTSAQFPDDQTEGLLGLSSGVQGCIISIAELKNPPAIDITHMVEFVVDSPKVFSTHSASAQRGSLYRSRDGKQNLLQADVMYRGSTVFAQYVKIRSQDDPSQVGQLQD